MRPLILSALLLAPLAAQAQQAPVAPKGPPVMATVMADDLAALVRLAANQPIAFKEAPMANGIIERVSAELDRVAKEHAAQEKALADARKAKDAPPAAQAPASPPNPPEHP